MCSLMCNLLSRWKNIGTRYTLAQKSINEFNTKIPHNENEILVSMPFIAILVEGISRDTCTQSREKCLRHMDSMQQPTRSRDIRHATDSSFVLTDNGRHCSERTPKPLKANHHTLHYAALEINVLTTHDSAHEHEI